MRLQSELEPAAVGAHLSLESQLEQIENDLAPWFTNLDNLSVGLGSGGLTYEHAFIQRTRTWAVPNLNKLLEEYRKAQARDATTLFRELGSFMPTMDTAYRHVVSIAELEADKANLSAYAFARSCLRDMGDLIESTLAPFMRLRLRVLALGGQPLAKTNLETLTLGEVVGALTNFDAALYTVGALGVSLSQWRNISHHSDYQAKAGVIVCNYGRGNARKSVRLSTDELLDLFIKVEEIYYVHKVAFEFFATDNIQAWILPEQHGENKITLSDLTCYAALAYGVVASGFRIEKVAKEKFRWAFVLTDRHAREPSLAKAALQDAVVPYVLHTGPIEFNAWVGHGSVEHFLSFRGEVRSSAERLPEHYSVTKLNRSFRVQKRDK